MAEFKLNLSLKRVHEDWVQRQLNRDRQLPSSVFFRIQIFNLKQLNFCDWFSVAQVQPKPKSVS